MSKFDSNFREPEAQLGNLRHCKCKILPYEGFGVFDLVVDTLKDGRWGCRRDAATAAKANRSAYEVKVLD